MPQPDPTPTPDDLPIMVGPGDVDQLLKTAEALAGEIAAAVGLADPLAQNADTIAPLAPMPSPVEPVGGHTVIEEAPPPPTAIESVAPRPEPTPAKTITPADAVPAAEIAPSATAAIAEPPAPAVEPPPTQSPVAVDPAPQAETETIEPQPQPEPIVAEAAPAPAAQPEAPPPAKVAHADDASHAPPKVSFFRRGLRRIMRLARGVALAPILLLAALAWLMDRPFAKTPPRVKNYIGAIALATAITAVLSFVLPDLLKNDPFAGESTASESAPG